MDVLTSPDHALARAASSKHIWLVDRSSFVVIVKLALIAVAAFVFWLFWLGDPCLSTEVSNRWTAKDPATVMAGTDAKVRTEVARGEVDLIDVDNPYGIQTCHFWLTRTDETVSTPVLILAIFSIGWFTARRVPRRPLLTAAAVTVFALMITFALQALVRLESFDMIYRELPLLFIVLFVGACVAMLSAWLSRTFARRA